jgi:hypothetical protein
MPHRCHHIAVQRERVVDHAFHRESAAGPAHGRAPHRCLQIRIGQQPCHRRLQGSRVARRNHVSRFPITIDPSDAGSHIRAHDGLARGHRFELHDAESFLPRHRRQHEHVAGAIECRQLVVGHRAQELHLLLHAQRAGLRFECSSQRSIADEVTDGVETCQRLEQHVGPFVWHEASDEEHDGAIRFGSNHAGAAENRLCVIAGRRLDAEGNHSDLRLEVLELGRGRSERRR